MDFQYNPQAVIDDLANQVAHLSKENAVLRSALETALTPKPQPLLPEVE